MTSFTLSCVDAGLMTHSKCNDNDVAGVLPTLQLQIMMALLPRKHNGITCYSHEIIKIKVRFPQRTFTDLVFCIARHCIPSNRCWCMSHPNQQGCRSRLCKVRADSTSSWARIIYKKCVIKTLCLVKHWTETCQGNISRIVCLNLHQVNELANLVRKIWQLLTSCISEVPLLWNTNIVKRNKVWSRKSNAYCIIWTKNN